VNPALWGGLTAVSWGTADFAARFSGRALGHANALLGMLLVGSLVLTAWVIATDATLVWETSGWWMLLGGGIGVLVATLLLYQGLARGPVTIVAPIVGSYPALILIFAVILGARPTALQWLGSAAVMGGVIIVARTARHFEEPGVTSLAALRRTVMIALGSALAFALGLMAAQQAVPIYGELQTLWLTRLISLAGLVLMFLLSRQQLDLALRWWPVLIAQGLLDGGGYLALFAGSHGAGSELAAVTSSAFGAVTVLLGRIFLREAMTWPQWGGIAFIFAGVATLSWPS
jgi:drug/metabolite transporter (DMT)-like permease